MKTLRITFCFALPTTLFLIGALTTYFAIVGTVLNFYITLTCGIGYCGVIGYLLWKGILYKEIERPIFF